MRRADQLVRRLRPIPAAAFIHRLPFILLVAVTRIGLSLEHLLRFGLAAVITVPLCFAAAYLVQKIPFMSRAL